MRLIFGLVAAGTLAALSQPALAVCVNRGGSSTCYDDPKYWTASTIPLSETPGAAPDASLKAIVLQPSVLSGNAWVVKQPKDGATASGGGNAAAPACILGANC